MRPLQAAFSRAVSGLFLGRTGVSPGFSTGGSAEWESCVGLRHEAFGTQAVIG